MPLWLSWFFLLIRLLCIVTLLLSFHCNGICLSSSAQLNSFFKPFCFPSWSISRFDIFHFEDCFFTSSCYFFSFNYRFIICDFLKFCIYLWCLSITDFSSPSSLVQRHSHLCIHHLPFTVIVFAPIFSSVSLPLRWFLCCSLCSLQFLHRNYQV